MTGNIQPNNTVHLTSQLIDTGTGDNRGNGNQSSSQIDSFLAGIRSNLTAINLPPPPSSTPSRNNTPKIQPTQFLQINLQHSKTASANLSKLSESKGFAICLVQEPWVTKRGISGIPPNCQTTCQGQRRGHTYQGSHITQTIPQHLAHPPI